MAFSHSILLCCTLPFIVIVLLPTAGAAAARRDDLVAAAAPPPRCGLETFTHLHFFFHETRVGDNRTTYTVGSLNNPNTSFGNVNVFDNVLRVGADPSSKVIGRAQGVGSRASLDQTRGWTSINFVFTEGSGRPYAGSTLTLLGLFMASGVSDRNIVGGTGYFRLARGVALNTITRTDWGILAEFDVFVWHCPDHDAVIMEFLRGKGEDYFGAGRRELLMSHFGAA